MDERCLACPMLGGCRPGAEVPRASGLGPDAPPARLHLPRWSGRLAFPAPWSASIPGPLCFWLPSGPSPVVPLTQPGLERLSPCFSPLPAELIWELGWWSFACLSDGIGKLVSVVREGGFQEPCRIPKLGLRGWGVRHWLGPGPGPWLLSFLESVRKDGISPALRTAPPAAGC